MDAAFKTEIELQTSWERWAFLIRTIWYHFGAFSHHPSKFIPNQGQLKLKCREATSWNTKKILKISLWSQGKEDFLRHTRYKLQKRKMFYLKLIWKFKLRTVCTKRQYKEGGKTKYFVKYSTSRNEVWNKHLLSRKFTHVERLEYPW